MRLLISLIILVLCLVSPSTGEEKSDVLIYGATPAGITTALAVAREGLNATIIEPSSHVGGMITAGLGGSDTCNDQKIAGLSRKFFELIGKEYGVPLSWRFEPHKAQKVINSWLRNDRIKVVLNDEISGLDKDGTRIKSVKTLSGRVFVADVFADATYEGDLLAKAGASFAIGRESREIYNESYAGIAIDGGPSKHNFPPKIAGRDAAGNLLPHISSATLLNPGAGDLGIPAYNFRPCITNNPSNHIPFEKPINYDKKEFELLARYIESLQTVQINNLFTTLKLPNGKADLNNGGPFSTDLIGGSFEYPLADSKKRREIWEKHKSYTQGLLYFLRTDQRVPARIREIMTEWGLCKDEFTENGNWPAQLYVRVGRRLVGEYVLRQSDLRRNSSKEDSIGVATCPIESHHIQRVIKDGSVFNEGFVFVRVKPYQIPYRSILPKKSEVKNLLVPVAVSASHIAYTSLRMEPVFMVLGESAGVAAAISLKNSGEERGNVHLVNLGELRSKLEFYGQALK